MGMSGKKVALFEYKFHDEVLLPQIHFLLSESVEVHLITTDEIIHNGLFDSILEKIHCYILPRENALFRKMRIISAVPRYIKKHKITHFVHNTLDGVMAYWLIDRLKNKTRQLGIAHNGRFFIENGKYVRNVPHIEHIYTLGSYVEDYLHEHGLEKVSTFYPVLPEFSLGHKTDICMEGKINISIPGQIEYQRRDYQALIRLAKKSQFVRDNLNFILLGNIKMHDGIELEQDIIDASVESCFTTFKSFVPYSVFVAVLKSSDFIMPLIHSNTAYSKNYTEDKISASMLWALSLNIPMIASLLFSKIEEYQEGRSVFYDESCLDKDFERCLSSYSLERELRVCLSFEEQKNKYVQFFMDEVVE